MAINVNNIKQFPVFGMRNVAKKAFNSTVRIFVINKDKNGKIGTPFNLTSYNHDVNVYYNYNCPANTYLASDSGKITEEEFYELLVQVKEKHNVQFSEKLKWD
jgi:hypothetical protein